MPVAGALFFPESVVEYRALLWLLALIPALLLAHYRAWRRVSVALAAGMAMLALTYVVALLLGKAAPDWPVLSFVIGAYIAIALGSGWLAEVRRAVTERRKAEQALQDSLDWQRAIVEGSRDAIFISDEDSRLVLANSAACELTGYSEEELLRMRIPDLHEEVDLDAYLAYHDAIMGGEDALTEAKILRRDGTKVDTEFNNRRTVIGGTAYMHTVARDITGKRHNDEALRGSEERFRAMAESAVDGIIVSDSYGKATFWNEGAREIFGYSSEEVLGNPLTVLMPEEFRAPHAQALERRRTTGETRLVGQTIELTGLRRDGTEVPVEISLSSWKTDGQRSFGGIIRDLTIRKQHEEEMRLAQRMDAMGQIAGGLAHDFKNILTVVGSTAELLSDSLPQDEQVLQEDVEELRKAAQQGRAMVEKLLVFGRPESGELLAIDLATVVREFEPTFGLLLPENIEVEIVGDEVLPPVLADHGSIEQIMMNLATNARDAMPSGGNLIIELSARSFAEEDREGQRGIRPGDYVCLAVSDTGEGMDAETRQRLFEPFFTTKAAGEGTGLGLPVVFGLTKQHGGFLHVYSEPGMGATFKVYLPVTKEEAAARPEAKAKAEIRGGSETILVVEDDSALRRVGRRTLERLGYTVLTANHGKQALEILREQSEEVDLVFSDVIMPSMSGPELLDVVRSEGIGVKFVFSSGHIARDVEVLTDLDPGLPFVGKPWSLAELAGTVREVLDGMS
ncbi:PAS domain S-box protein [Gemmatimonadota bacterium]